MKCQNNKGISLSNVVYTFFIQFTSCQILCYLQNGDNQHLIHQLTIDSGRKEVEQTKTLQQTLKKAMTLTQIYTNICRF